MIKPINSVNFCASYRKNDLRKIKESDYTSSPKIVDYSQYETKKVKPVPLLSALALAITLLGTGGVISTQGNNRQNASSSETKFPTVYADNQQTPKKISVNEAVETIQASPKLKEVYGNMIETIQNMEKTIDNPIDTLNNILAQPYAKGMELEYVLPQIYCESSGNHYDENGNVLQSYAFCNGWMQLSEDATTDMNKAQFKNDKKDRNVPLDNLNLGICFDSYLLEQFDGDLFDALAAYNCGPANVKNGKTYGDDYAKQIIEYGNILKNNPQFTQMLLCGKFDEYKNDFLYN